MEGIGRFQHREAHHPPEVLDRLVFPVEVQQDLAEGQVMHQPSRRQFDCAAEVPLGVLPRRLVEDVAAEQVPSSPARDPGEASDLGVPLPEYVVRAGVRGASLIFIRMCVECLAKMVAVGR